MLTLPAGIWVQRPRPLMPWKGHWHVNSGTSAAQLLLLGLERLPFTPSGLLLAGAPAWLWASREQGVCDSREPCSHVACAWSSALCPSSSVPSARSAGARMRWGTTTSSRPTSARPSSSNIFCHVRSCSVCDRRSRLPGG